MDQLRFELSPERKLLMLLVELEDQKPVLEPLSRDVPPLTGQLLPLPKRLKHQLELPFPKKEESEPDRPELKPPSDPEPTSALVQVPEQFVLAVASDR